MQRSRTALLAASAVALLGAGTATAVTPATTQPPASVASAYTPLDYRSLRKSTGTHKQNRRRLLAGRT